MTLSRRCVVAILAVVLGGASCRKSHVPLTCTTADELGDLKTSQVAVKAADADWLADAYVCMYGETRILLPKDPTRRAYMISRKGGPEISWRSSDLMVLDDKYLAVYLVDNSGDGHLDQVGYTTWVAKHHYLDAYDSNLDGQTDFRSIEQADGTLRHEAWVGDRWREVSVRKGFRPVDKPGVRLKKDADGNFIEVADE